MKRKLITLIALLLSLVFTLSLTGCNLITTNNDRDMKQVIATVQISEDAPLDEIYKQDLAMAYLNYGYSYQQYYGYSQEKTLNTILNSMVNTRIMIQSAMSEFEKGTDFTTELDNDFTKWDVKRYLSADEKLDAEYQVIHAFNDLIDGYDEAKKDNKKSDTLGETVRTVPSDAKNKEKEVDKAQYVEKGIDYNSTSSRRKAYNEVKKLLEANYLLGAKDSYKGTPESTDYYDLSLKNAYENALMSKYERAIATSFRNKFDFESLKTAFTKTFEKQQNWTTAEFASALSSASATDPILVSNAGTYGYVYNLLIGVDDKTKEEISKIEKTLTEELDRQPTKQEIANKRMQILTNSETYKAKDLRSTWITSGYDLENNEGVVKFTGDYAFLDNSLPFKGEVSAIEGEENRYAVNSVDEFSLTEFTDLVETYVYGAVKTTSRTPSGDTYSKFNSVESIENYDEKINELLFAFSTDGGSLNTYKGYAIKPAVEGSATEEFVESFANAGRELLGMGKSSYIAVASDFGIHFMFYSQVFDANYDATNGNGLVGFLNGLVGQEKDEAFWTTKLGEVIANFDKFEEYSEKAEQKEFKKALDYIYSLFNSVSSGTVSEKLNTFELNLFNETIYGSENQVKIYKERFSDLLG